MTERITEKELEFESYNRTISEMTGRLGSLESELNGAKNTITNLQKDLGEFKTKNNTLKIDYDQVVSELATANAILFVPAGFSPPALLIHKRILCETPTLKRGISWPAPNVIIL